MPRRFDLVDVFAAADFAGNPLAVVHDAEGLSSERMQAITRWLNLSETTFLLPPADPAADYRVRIFTLERELPFAGHPTLGSAHAWLGAGGRPQREGVVMQECGAGLIPVRRGAGRLAFAAPPLLRSGPLSADALREALDICRLSAGDVIESRWIDNGPGWRGLMLKSAEAVLKVDYQKAWPRRADIGLAGAHAAGPRKVGLAGAHGPEAGPAFEVRALFSDQTLTMREDPVTGSLNAAVAQWLYDSGRVTGDYIAAQGTALGRLGRVHVSRDDSIEGHGTIWIGGATRTLFSGVATTD